LLNEALPLSYRPTRPCARQGRVDRTGVEPVTICFKGNLFVGNPGGGRPGRPRSGERAEFGPVQVRTAGLLPDSHRSSDYESDALLIELFVSLPRRGYGPEFRARRRMSKIGSPSDPYESGKLRRHVRYRNVSTRPEHSVCRLRRVSTGPVEASEWGLLMSLSGSSPVIRGPKASGGGACWSRTNCSRLEA